MARTYGEILEASFPDVFRFASGPDTVFVDIGSGHGTITFEAVQKHGCSFAIGIEKYREPAAICSKRLAQLPREVTQKLRFVLEDISDADLLREVSGLSFRRLLLFCNNLAFSQGTLNRLSRKFEELSQHLEQDIILVSTVPLPRLASHFRENIYLQMSWTTELHESCVYTKQSEQK